jgi:hypothetical protein
MEGPTATPPPNDRSSSFSSLPAGQRPKYDPALDEIDPELQQASKRDAIISHIPEEANQLGTWTVIGLILNRTIGLFSESSRYSTWLIAKGLVYSTRLQLLYEAQAVWEFLYCFGFVGQYLLLPPHF